MHERNDPFLEALLADTLAERADRIHATVTIGRVHARMKERRARRRVTLARPLALLGVAAAVMLPMAALIVAQRPDRQSPAPAGDYEAVFAREMDGSGSAIDLAVVGVDGHGNERGIARLPDRGERGQMSAHLIPMGAVTLGGRLLVPTNVDGYLFRWEIVDLHDPTAKPIAVAGIQQDVEQLQTPYYDTGRRPGIYPGPGERLAIPWYDRAGGPGVWHVDVVDARTGASTSVILSGSVGLLPQWPADGSGLLVDADGSGPGSAIAVLHPDGTLTEGTAGVSDSGFSRHIRSDGTVTGAPGPSADARHPDVDREAVWLPADATITGVAWTARGDGIWVLQRTSANGGDLSLTLQVRSEVETRAAIHDDATGPGGSYPEGHILGLAPDDSLMVLSVDRVTEAGNGWPDSPAQPGMLVDPHSGAAFRVEGSFAGWLKMGR